MEKIKVYTHHDLDGVGCAILAKIAFADDVVDIEYCGYDDINEKVSEFFESGKDRDYYRIYITDLSIRESLADVIDRYGSGKWTLLDHHATATGLNKYGWCKINVFADDVYYGELKTCGTELFYDSLLCDGYFDAMSDSTKETLWTFVQMVRDWDTWRWKDLGEEGERSKWLNDLLYIYGREEFIKWVMNLVRDDVGGVEFSETDLQLLANSQRSLDEFVCRKNNELIVFNDRFGKLCGVVFAERYFSELGNRLSELHPELDYIAMIDVAGRKVSYRTVKDDIDLGKEIAHAYGGGGHAKAAGSTFGEEVWFDIFAHLFTTTAL